MADEVVNERGHGDEEPERRKAAGGVSLAEEGGDELPALLAIAVGIAVIVVILGGSVFDWRTGTVDVGTGTETVDDGAATDEAADTDEAEGTDEETTATTEADDEPQPAPEGVADADLEALNGRFPDLGITAAGGVLTLTGEVADEAARSEAVAAAEALPGVTEVDDQLTIAATEGAMVEVAASQAAIVLSGTVPDQAFADEILSRAQAIYSEDQIDNQIQVDGNAGPPVAVTVTGSTTDEVLYNQVLTGFDGITGIDPIDASGFQLEDSNELESSLNTLEPIQFASGSAQILPASEPVLDQAAEFLTANPDVSIEIGGHTDSIGEPGGNQTLSQARADAVRDALLSREVGNEMVSRGFGETRLKHDPDDTAEKQQENRRIEFRIL
ncbi:MAG: OmpA family protein [Actinomycetota bacterium]